MSLQDLLSPLQRKLTPLQERGIRLPAPAEPLVDGNARRPPAPGYEPGYEPRQATPPPQEHYDPRPVGSWSLAPVPPPMPEAPPPAHEEPPTYQPLTAEVFANACNDFLQTAWGHQLAHLDEPMPAPAIPDVAAGSVDHHDVPGVPAPHDLLLE